MRILVLSDSHRDIASLRLALTRNDADVLVFLGDGLNDWEEVLPLIGNKRFIAVKGNNDYDSMYPLNITEKINGQIVYCTHGHREGVKYGLKTLEQKARKMGAAIALFGHTHVPYTSYDDGLYIMNPGSVRQNSCGIIDITNKGIMCFTKKIVNDY